jgi:predicted nucleotidyltransferase component of viral defense system
MISKQEIVTQARKHNLNVNIVEKDYVLTWILVAINHHKDLAGKWIFKGGTCLKKCYFQNYRFSEDLDFTILDPAHLQLDFLYKTFCEIADWVYEKTGMDIPKRSIKFDIHPEIEKGYVEGRIYYTGPLRQKGSLAKIVLDLTSNELLVLNPEKRPILHGYTDFSEELMFANCYSFTEIFAEKFRALAQRLRPRDLYDIIRLYENRAMLNDKSVLTKVIDEKFAFKGIFVPSIDGIHNHKHFDELSSEWDNMLKHQLSNLEPMEQYINQLPAILLWLQK